MAIVTRFLRPPAGSFFLFGPRGTGKSTWLQQVFPTALRLDLLAPEILRAYQARPERLRERVDAVIGQGNGPTTVVIDEIQKAPELLNVVHALVEAQPGLRFVLTGSSARKLRHGAANLLGGRLVAAHMPPFLAAELEDEFNLERALQIGLVPLVWQAPDPQATLAAYAALYLQEEVQAEALVRQIGAFARFLEVISFSHGSQLNLAELAREAEIPRKRAESYLGVLEDLLLGYRLPVFQRRAQRQLVQHQKFFFFDAGVFRSLRPRGPLDSPAEIDGLALEGLVAQHLQALCQLRQGGAKLCFWRTRAGLEVDFVVYGPDIFLAVEVKRSSRIDRRDLTGLKAFGVDYPEAERVLLSFMPEPLLIDGIRCEPIGPWLITLKP
ncbi:ATP-binding protein [Cyanobium sp. WAJ14-Wanaka]|uniref:ATP-binding protein n=1 Tax=Cyanobium sp. WAJ14-Wanaka TaxID=2823725 RepID=UPI0020CC7AE2|nr:AAA family ATPase [Cyanobium sp. WAJ14-Wanaka]MCP9775627.1 ATP-binding protein [Cyanobium sp. WAJ14-Wanaka]